MEERSAVDAEFSRLVSDLVRSLPTTASADLMGFLHLIDAKRIKSHLAIGEDGTVVLLLAAPGDTGHLRSEPLHS